MSMCGIPTQQCSGETGAQDGSLYFSINSFVEDKRSRLWHFPACCLFNFPSASLPLLSKGTSACFGEQGRRLDLCHLGPQSQSMDPVGRKERRLTNGPRKWNENKQSAESKAVLPRQSRQWHTQTGRATHRGQPVTSSIASTQGSDSWLPCLYVVSCSSHTL